MFGEVASKTGAVNNADLLQSLKSNAFGAKAYLMIKTSGKLNLFISHGQEENIMYFSVKQSVKIAGKAYIPCVCYPLPEALKLTVEQLKK